MPDYSKGNIYKLCCNDTDITDIYIGSTCNFTHRKYLHKSKCNNEKDKNYNYYVYKFIRENGGWDNWSMILVEEVCCENKKQLNQKEREWIEKLKSTLNKKLPNRTPEEYEKTEIRKNYKKKYHIKNKERIKEYQKKSEKFEKYQKEYNKIKVVCECGCEVLKRGLSRHKKRDIHKRLMNELN